jgi:catecholate siderophore receptor
VIKRFAVRVAGALFAITAPAWCAASGAVSGTIFDQTGAVIEGARISIQRPDGVPQTAVSDHNGKYNMPALPPGPYTVTAEKTNFVSKRRTLNIPEIPAAPAELNFVLEAAPIRESITVTDRVGYQVVTSATATRTLTPLRDIPQSVEVVGPEMIREQAALSMQDVLRNVSGVSVHMGEGRRDQVYIRGYSALRDLYVDGVRDDAAYYRDLSNIEQVEVIKGPASVLFGRGSSGGLVNRVTKKPNSERPIAEVFATFGSYGTKRTGADLGLPLNDKVAFRVNGATEESGSHRHYYRLSRYAVTPSLSWRPTESTSVLAQVEQLSDDRIPDRGIPSLNGVPAPVGVGLYYGTPGEDFLRNQVSAQALSIDHAFNPSWTIRNTFRHSNYRNTYSNTYATGVSAQGSSYLVSRGQYNTSARQENYFNQTESVTTFRLLHMTHVVLTGFEAGNQDVMTTRFTGTAGRADLFNPVLTRPIYAAVPASSNDFGGRTYGFYAQDQITIAPKWKALVGVRRDHYRQAFNDLLPQNNDLGRTDRAWSPRAGLVYQPTQWLSLYGSYSRSFIPSGDGLSLALNTADLKPETAENYELGAKTEALSGRLSINFAAFRLDRNNVRTIDPINPNVLVLVGKQRTNGAEVSVAGNLRRRWNIFAGYALLNARILRSNDVSSGVRVEGNRAGHIPLHSGNIWSTYSFENGFGFGGGINSNAARYTSNDNLVRLPSYTRVDATVFYRKSRYEVSLNVRNLFDTNYYETAHGNFAIYPGAPINGLLNVRYRW